MKDKEFLQWIYDRMAHVHKENKSVDYMLKLRSIIMLYPKDKVSPNTYYGDHEGQV